MPAAVSANDTPVEPQSAPQAQSEKNQSAAGSEPAQPEPEAKAGELDTSWLTSEAPPATGLPMAEPEEGAAEPAIDESEYE